ncbi:MAG: glycosyltransferase [Defluviitaleaceae bacterium]|nr:glycosyltransferase [Defluviitaleaceae bacterium]
MILNNKKNNPTVSIIMPAFNAGKTIKASIDSVVAQTYCNWELIVIDDGSQDTTLQIIKDAADGDSRICVEVNEHNMGVASTRNVGIARAKGMWIAFLDADDLWINDKLSKQLRFMKHHDALISYTSTAYINEKGEASGYILEAKLRISYKELLWRNLMSCSSVIVRRDIMPFFTQGEVHEDYVAWLTILRKVGHAYGLNEPLLTYRIAANSKSHKRLRSARMIFNAYKQVEYGWISALFMTMRYVVHSVPKRLYIRYFAADEGGMN